jgi:hypothetical protein
MNDRLALFLVALLTSACGKTTREPAMVCVDSGNEIALDEACTDVETWNCDDPQDCYLTGAVAVTCETIRYKVSSCFSCGVLAKFRTTISNRCATTLDLLAVELIPEIATPGSWEAGVDLVKQREQGLRCLIDRLHYMTISCNPEIPCLDLEVAGQCESP